MPSKSLWRQQLPCFSSQITQYPDDNSSIYIDHTQRLHLPIQGKMKTFLSRRRLFSVVRDTKTKVSNATSPDSVDKTFYFGMHGHTTRHEIVLSEVRNKLVYQYFNVCNEFLQTWLVSYVNLGATSCSALARDKLFSWMFDSIWQLCQLDQPYVVLCVYVVVGREFQKLVNGQPTSKYSHWCACHRHQ